LLDIVMAVELTEEQISKCFEEASSDLKFLFDKEGVDRLTQARLYEAGVHTVKQLAVLCKDVDELRGMAKEALDIDPTKGLREKAKLSRVLVAFEMAKVRSAKIAEMEGDATVREVPKSLAANDFHGMRDAFEAKHWELEDRRAPSRTYLEKKLEAIEKNDLRVEPLSEVTNVKEDDGGDTLRTIWDSQGNLSAVKKSAKVDLPQDAEGLRHRVTLMGSCWLFAGLQQTNREYLKGLAPQLFQDYLDYLLGEHVFGLVVKGSGGTYVGSGPSWQVLLNYEFEIRVKAYKSIQKGMKFKDALVQAWSDPVVKERYFTTPVAWEAMGGVKRKYKEDDDKDVRKVRNDKDKGKPKGKGKGQGTGLKLEGC
jgi:hypothetical protein